ncbi:nucleotide pyrophosphohydrolase [Nitrospirota bacterium]
MTPMDELRESLRTFARERDWEQFHTPKNLAMALSVEVSEIVELFQWLRDDESFTLSEEKLAALSDEIGDVMIYLTSLADKFDIDPLDAANEKMKKNAVAYPQEKSRGKALKYTEYIDKNK